MKVRANQLDIEVEDSATAFPAHRDRPAVLLIMGLGMQLVAWPQPLLQSLMDAGYRVIRFDNRDIGLSSHLDALGKPSMVWSMLQLKLGLLPRTLYTLSDMAMDSVGVLDALGVERAHVVGVSMGGMIAQRVAIAAPARVRSLTSIMSSSGAKHLPPPAPAVLRVMLSRPQGSDEASVLAYYLRLFKAIGSPAYPIPEAEMRDNILRGVRRSYHPVGVMRQMLAVGCDITRAAQLARIQCPTLVVHGKADPLVPYACGEDTARRIAGAQLLGIEGMGHDLPAKPVATMVQAMLAFFAAQGATP